MKYAFITLIASTLAGAAHAEKFDLVCKTKLKTEIVNRPPSEMEQEMSYSLDTDIKTIVRRTGPDQTPIPLEVFDDRFTFEIAKNQWTIDRASNRISTSVVTSVFSHKLTGDCVKQPSALN